MNPATTTQPKLFQSNELNWTFRSEDTRQLTHCYHDYPARMIPQVARQFLELFGKNCNGILFDPYCGTGTSLVEGFIKGFDVIGLDLNPLAHLIAKTKTTVFNLSIIDSHIKKYDRYITTNPKNIIIPQKVEGVSRLEFWFKPDVVEKLAFIKNFIDEITNFEIKSFFLIAFSETVRESSNTRNHEFKLYRYSKNDLKTFQPDVYSIMSAKIRRNRKGLMDFLSVVEKLSKVPQSDVFEFNTVEDYPSEFSNKVDFVLTSPPYGDSHTTVAYGQYSRLSAAWLDLPEPAKIDRKLMGGIKSEKIKNFNCDELNEAISQISQENEKRAKEVSSFYEDLYNSINNVSKLVKTDGLVCYVVGNRRVKGVCLPTDLAVQSFFENNDFTHIKTFHREIPNKRMPLRNSPSNKIGKTQKTMNREYIIVLRKR